VLFLSCKANARVSAWLSTGKITNGGYPVTRAVKTVSVDVFLVDINNDV